MAPGLLGMVVMFGALLAALSTVTDRDAGVLRMVLVAPIRRSAIALGKTLGATLLGTTQAVAVAVLLLPLVHLRPGFGDVLRAGLALVLSSFAIGALGLVLAASIRSLENFAGVMNFVVFPMLFLSGALYPVRHLGPVLRLVAYANPLAYGVDLLKHALLGAWAGAGYGGGALPSPRVAGPAAVAGGGVGVAAPPLGPGGRGDAHGVPGAALDEDARHRADDEYDEHGTDRDQQRIRRALVARHLHHWDQTELEQPDAVEPEQHPDGGKLREQGDHAAEPVGRAPVRRHLERLHPVLLAAEHRGEGVDDHRECVHPREVEAVLEDTARHGVADRHLVGSCQARAHTKQDRADRCGERTDRRHGHEETAVDRAGGAELSRDGGPLLGRLKQQALRAHEPRRQLARRPGLAGGLDRGTRRRSSFGLGGSARRGGPTWRRGGRWHDGTRYNTDSDS